MLCEFIVSVVCMSKYMLFCQGKECAQIGDKSSWVFFKIFISPFNTFSLEHLWTVLVSLFLGDILSKEPQGAGFTLIYLTSIIKCVC